MKVLRAFLFIALLASITGCITVTATIPAHHDHHELRHIVLIRFQSDAPAAEIDRVLREFRGLEDKIDEVAHFEYGVDVSGRGLNQGFERGGVFTFHSQDDLDTYRAHPAHVDFVDNAMPYVDGIFVFDYYPE